MWEKGVLVTYGDTYYSKNPTTPDLVVHESVHMHQQLEMGIQEWWKKYIDDDSFRIDQEVEAYRTQVQHLKNYSSSMSRDERRQRIAHCARTLSSDLYGRVINYKKAFNLITR